MAAHPKTAARDRRVARQGEDDRGLPRHGLHRRVVDRPHPRPAAQRLRGSRRARRASRGRASASTSTTTSSRSTSSIAEEEGRRRPEARSSRTPTSSCSRRTKTARARRSPGISREVLKPKVPVRRMVFHEITAAAIERALDETREIDDAARRRAGDPAHPRPPLRLRGLAGALAKVMQGLSAGRVQSVATRLVVERERERMAFVAAEYWDIVAHASSPATFTARLAAVDGERVAQGRDFGRDGKLTRRRRRAARRGRRARARGRARRRGLRGRSVEGKPYTPPPGGAVHDLDAAAGGEPQAAALARSRRCASPSASTRTATSPTCAPTRRRCRSRRSPRRATRRASSTAPTPCPPSRGATAARSRTRRRRTRRSARPATASARPTRCAGELSGDELALYDLIWKRTVASQMADARGETVSVRHRRRPRPTAATAEFATAGTVITFRGFLLAYEEGRDEPSRRRRGEACCRRCRGRRARRRARSSRTGHSTTPPARYTEATLVQALEERGIGRPSTYAAIMGTILDRGYVRKQGQALVPTFLAFAVSNLLEQHFAQLVDYEFTARMEDDLDRIASGEEERSAGCALLLRRRTATTGLKALVDGLSATSTRARSTRSRSATDIVLRVGRTARTSSAASERADAAARHRARRADARARRGAARAGPEQRELGVDPETGRTIVVQDRPLRAVRDRGAAEGDEKPRTGSLFKSMSPETVTLEDALRLLSLPRTSATVRRRGDRRRERPLRPVHQEGHRDALARERGAAVHGHARRGAGAARPAEARGGRRAAAPPLRELGADPVSGKPIVVKEGRFGPYVTDGETNASLRAGDTVEAITHERAAELLAGAAANAARRRRSATQAEKRS